MQAGGGDLCLGALADHVEFALERVLVHAGGAPDKDLLDIRLRGAGDPANRVGVDRCVPPAEDPEALLAHDSLQDALRDEPLMSFHRQKHHSHAVLARLRQAEAEARAFARKELVRDLDQDAGTIAGLRVAAASAAVRQVEQDLDALEDDVVRLLAPYARDEANAASVVLVSRIV